MDNQKQFRHYKNKTKMPLTLCPLSNLKLKVVKNLEEHPLKKLLDKGVIVTINSDDPAYFGGDINENYHLRGVLLIKPLTYNLFRYKQLIRLNII